MSQEILSKLNTTHIEEISSSRNEPDWLKDYRKNSLSVYDNLPHRDISTIQQIH